MKNKCQRWVCPGLSRRKFPWCEATRWVFEQLAKDSVCWNAFCWPNRLLKYFHTSQDAQRLKSRRFHIHLTFLIYCRTSRYIRFSQKCPVSMKPIDNIWNYTVLFAHHRPLLCSLTSNDICKGNVWIYFHRFGQFQILKLEEVIRWLLIVMECS